METLSFLLVLLVTVPVQCTVLAPNSTWWPCSALIPHQNLQLQQVIIFVVIFNSQGHTDSRAIMRFYVLMGTQVSYEPATSIFIVEDGNKLL